MMIDESAMFDVVVGGGPAGATCGSRARARGPSRPLARQGRDGLPCGGAIPAPCATSTFPSTSSAPRINAARMVAPSQRTVDMPIDGGYVGMVDREVFDEFLRERAAAAGAVRVSDTSERISPWTTRARAPRSLPTRNGVSSRADAPRHRGPMERSRKVARQEVSARGPRLRLRLSRDRSGAG